jgi:hypothetical protein
MNEALRYIELAIEALRRRHPSHLILRELEACRETLMILHRAELNSPTSRMSSSNTRLAALRGLSTRER